MGKIINRIRERQEEADINRKVNEYRFGFVGKEGVVTIRRPPDYAAEWDKRQNEMYNSLALSMPIAPKPQSPQEPA